MGGHPMGESEESMKELYNFFCSATHPNRELIPRRFLGEGNEYVLGVIGKPELVLITDYCMNALSMWFWLTATVAYFYRKVLEEHDKTYFAAYRHASDEAKRVSQWLVENHNHLLKEAQEHWDQHSVQE